MTVTADNISQVTVGTAETDNYRPVEDYAKSGSGILHNPGNTGASTPSDSDPSHTWTNEPYAPVVDISNYTGTFDIRWTANGQTLYAASLSGAQIDSGRVAIINAHAYEELSVNVTGVPDPDYETDGNDVFSNKKHVLGSTGGDKDQICDPTDRLAGAIGVTMLDCTESPGIERINTTDTDASQVKSDIYQSGQSAKASADTYHATLDNYLDDTANTARIIGKNAYVRALNNGSSKAAAKTAAKQAVSDYYATKQRNLVNQWNTQLAEVAYLDQVARNETDISANYVSLAYHEDGNMWDSGTTTTWQDGTTVLPLVNGQSIKATTANITGSREGAGYASWSTWGPTGITDSSHKVPETYVWFHHGYYYDYNNTDRVELLGVTVSPPNENFNSTRVMSFQRYETAWTAIEQQNQQVQADMDTVVNNTYDAYRAGEINNSELVDPYVLARRDPGQGFQTWAAGQLVLTGQGVPDDFDQLGAFNITTENGDQYRGILTSPGNPPSGQFAVGETYNPDRINGTQYVILSDRYAALESNFTIHEIRTVNNETRQNVTIETPSYQTANVSQLEDEIEYLIELRKEQEARENNLDAGAGGGIIGSGGNSAILLVLAGGVVALILAGGD
ncbi:hypothetical protein [Haloarcula pelagica]|uniref:hypothetical protein n=1 Tax=Haloarcula pelagica TaxID=3033389 RepID=UPI0024C30135|nr:hypothetical protein [Halomicroarcula sp. YJ-61-S]